MNFKMIFHTIAKILLVEAFLMLLPFAIALFNYFDGTEDLIDVISFAIPIGIMFIIGLPLVICKPKNRVFYVREGFIVVGLSWIVMSLFGCLPFMISKTIPKFINAFFETVSGFTTTGSSILTNLDDWHDNYKSLLMWRSFTHWIGGMGVLVFILAIMPKSEGQSIYILRAESTGPQVGKLVSKIKVTARILYLIYIAMTLIEACLLFVGTLPVYADLPIKEKIINTLFDSFANAFATAGTGGFGLYSDSFAHYNSYCQVVVAVFMMLFGINFNIFYLILTGKALVAIKNEELITYLSIILVSTITIALAIYLKPTDAMKNIATVSPLNPYIARGSFTYDNFGVALKDSYFQVMTILSTAGFATTDFTYWPMIAQTILFLLMFIGGCAGSTGGGIKVSRFVILFKSLKREIKKMVHPRSVNEITMDGTTIDESVVKGVTNYFGAMIALLIIFILIISFNGFDFETNITAVAACLNNIGPGLGKLIGPAGSFNDFNFVSKLTLIFAMLIGRLEIYPILLLFSPKVWLNR